MYFRLFIFFMAFSLFIAEVLSIHSSLWTIIQGIPDLVEKRYEESKTEDCLHCGINEPRKSNPDCKDCDVCDGLCGEPCYSGSYLEFLMLLEEENEIESMHEDPAANTAEMEQQIEYIENLFEKGQIFKQEIIEIEKSSPYLEDYDFEFLLLDARDYCYMIENLERQIEFII